MSSPLAGKPKKSTINYGATRAGFAGSSSSSSFFPLVPPQEHVVRGVGDEMQASSSTFRMTYPIPPPRGPPGERGADVSTYYTRNTRTTTFSSRLPSSSPLKRRRRTRPAWDYTKLLHEAAQLLSNIVRGQVSASGRTGAGSSTTSSTSPVVLLESNTTRTDRVDAPDAQGVAVEESTDGKRQSKNYYIKQRSEQNHDHADLESIVFKSGSQAETWQRLRKCPDPRVQHFCALIAKAKGKENDAARGTSTQNSKGPRETEQTYLTGIGTTEIQHDHAQGDDMQQDDNTHTFIDKDDLPFLLEEREALSQALRHAQKRAELDQRQKELNARWRRLEARCESCEKISSTGDGRLEERSCEKFSSKTDGGGTPGPADDFRGCAVEVEGVVSSSAALALDNDAQRRRAVDAQLPEEQREGQGEDQDTTGVLDEAKVDQDHDFDIRKLVSAELLKVSLEVERRCLEQDILHLNTELDREDVPDPVVQPELSTDGLQVGDVHQHVAVEDALLDPAATKDIEAINVEDEMQKLKDNYGKNEQEEANDIDNKPEVKASTSPAIAPPTLLQHEDGCNPEKQEEFASKISQGLPVSVSSETNPDAEARDKIRRSESAEQPSVLGDEIKSLVTLGASPEKLTKHDELKASTEEDHVDSSQRVKSLDQKVPSNQNEGAGNGTLSSKRARCKQRRRKRTRKEPPLEPLLQTFFTIAIAVDRRGALLAFYEELCSLLVVQEEADHKRTSGTPRPMVRSAYRNSRLLTLRLGLELQGHTQASPASLVGLDEAEEEVKSKVLAQVEEEHDVTTQHLEPFQRLCSAALQLLHRDKHGCDQTTSTTSCSAASSFKLIDLYLPRGLSRCWGTRRPPGWTAADSFFHIEGVCFFNQDENFVMRTGVRVDEEEVAGHDHDLPLPVVAEDEEQDAARHVVNGEHQQQSTSDGLTEQQTSSSTSSSGASSSSSARRCSYTHTLFFHHQKARRRSADKASIAIESTSSRGHEYDLPNHAQHADQEHEDDEETLRIVAVPWQDAAQTTWRSENCSHPLVPTHDDWDLLQRRAALIVPRRHAHEEVERGPLKTKTKSGGVRSESKSSEMKKTHATSSSSSSKGGSKHEGGRGRRTGRSCTSRKSTSSKRRKKEQRQLATSTSLLPAIYDLELSTDEVLSLIGRSASSAFSPSAATAVASRLAVLDGRMYAFQHLESGGGAGNTSQQRRCDEKDDDREASSPAHSSSIIEIKTPPAVVPSTSPFPAATTNKAPQAKNEQRSPTYQFFVRAIQSNGTAHSTETQDRDHVFEVYLTKPTTASSLLQSPQAAFSSVDWYLTLQRVADTSSTSRTRRTSTPSCGVFEQVPNSPHATSITTINDEAIGKIEIILVNVENAGVRVSLVPTTLSTFLFGEDAEVSLKKSLVSPREVLIPFRTAATSEEQSVLYAVDEATSATHLAVPVKGSVFAFPDQKIQERSHHHQQQQQQQQLETLYQCSELGIVLASSTSSTGRRQNKNCNSAAPGVLETTSTSIAGELAAVLQLSQSATRPIEKRKASSSSLRKRDDAKATLKYLEHLQKRCYQMCLRPRFKMPICCSSGLLSSSSPSQQEHLSGSLHILSDPGIASALWSVYNLHVIFVVEVQEEHFEQEHLQHYKYNSPQELPPPRENHVDGRLFSLFLEDRSLVHLLPAELHCLVHDPSRRWDLVEAILDRLELVQQDMRLRRDAIRGSAGTQEAALLEAVADAEAGATSKMTPLIDDAATSAGDHHRSDVEQKEPVLLHRAFYRAENPRLGTILFPQCELSIYKLVFISGASNKSVMYRVQIKIAQEQRREDQEQHLSTLHFELPSLDIKKDQEADTVTQHVLTHLVVSKDSSTSTSMTFLQLRPPDEDDILDPTCTGRLAVVKDEEGEAGDEKPDSTVDVAVDEITAMLDSLVASDSPTTPDDPVVDHQFAFVTECDKVVAARATFMETLTTSSKAASSSHIAEEPDLQTPMLYCKTFDSTRNDDKNSSSSSFSSPDEGASSFRTVEIFDLPAAPAASKKEVVDQHLLVQNRASYRVRVVSLLETREKIVTTKELEAWLSNSPEEADLLEPCREAELLSLVAERARLTPDRSAVRLLPHCWMKGG
ncbi:unnamed protein product [Amoebophrya sp. A25]|nr:unnamed protein product [Amoebophrya sp. A25]|eukprot:GSA25T00025528001.1